MIRTIAVAACLLISTQLFAQEGSIRGVHDPTIIAQGEWYYIFSTYMGQGIPIRRSKDLRNWEYVGEVFTELPQWARQLVKNGNPWAPDIAYFNGRYLLYYSVAVTTPGTVSCIGLATNKTLDPRSPDYKWQDQGLVLANKPGQDDFAAIDPNFILANGQAWLALGSTGGGSLRLVKLDRNGKPAAGSRLIPIAGKHEPCIEAPLIIRRQQWFYLFVSYDECCKGVASSYKIMVGRAKRIDGPYEDFAGRPMLEGNATLVLSGHGSVRGPGHNAVIRVKDQDYLVHHFYDARDNGSPTLQIRPLLWTRDGWPVAGEPEIFGDRKKTAVPVAGRWKHSVDFGKEMHLDLLANGRIKDSAGRWSARGSILEIRWPHADAPMGAWRDECILSPDGSWYAGRNQHGAVIRGIRVEN